MYAQLGDTIFEGKKGFQAFSRGNETDYAQHALIEGKPKLQRVGEKLGTISLTILLHSSFCFPEEEIEKLQTARAGGYILPFILGNGIVLGEFVLLSVKDEISQTDQVSNIVSTTVTLELLEYYETDPVKREKRQAQLDAFAVDTNNARLTATQGGAYVSPGTQVTTEVASQKSESKKIDRNINEAAVNPSKAAKASDNITKSVNKMNSSIRTIRNALVTTQKLQQLAQSLPQSLDHLETTLVNLKNAMPITDINAARRASSDVSGAVLGVNNSQTGISKAVITRKI